ncbi:sensor histidine kinase [Streptomyces sp. ISL-22]|uniref:sensor histidine kinase n=1 Tax=unclassified Streptomyces TaxID=2593676 RepID=UPI001BE5F518|nr:MULTISPECIES: histidine kinase [unclassified Streptomyces]MBT2416369.1 sensor histidine kinase [Streptomyces sp. ISL-24]MBT2434168.1 sensor histidine kinase [Streptomyces sp. ISL-22]
MKSLSPRGCARGFAVGVLLAACVVDVLYAGADGTSVVPTADPVLPTLAVLLVGLAAVLWPTERRPEWLTPPVRTAVPALVSALYSVGSLLTGRAITFGPGEVVITLCLLFVAVRHCPPRWAVVCALLDAGALFLLPVRHLRSVGSDTQAFALVGLVLIGLFAGLAVYLRTLDYRRTLAVSGTRRAERLAIAADLHDFVAHHVTGILVQTQVARMMAQTRPRELDPVLAGIEQAATEALASMRRTVGVLRDTGEEAADHRPVGDLAAIADLTDGFASPAQQVTLRRDPAVSDDLPHEVQATAFRVVQEALTNIRRHAADATHVEVGLRDDAGRLEVSVADDGRGGTQLPAAAHDGGFGLVGLKERVTALGGELHAGPRGDVGWEVRAVFPARRS